MESLIIEGTLEYPDVNCDYDGGVIEIAGRCVPSNSQEFFQPILDWADNYAGNPQPETHIIIKLEYFNSSSLKYILTLLNKMDIMHTEGKSNATVSWYCIEGDEDILETAADFKNSLNMSFEIIEVNE